MKNYKNRFIFQDIAIIFLSILLAIVLIKTHSVEKILGFTEFNFLSSFIAGIFFTSIFTAAPSIVTLGEISLVSPILLVAFWGALGSVVGDLIIFKFTRDRLSRHITTMINEKVGKRRLKTLFKQKLFRWITFTVGVFIIASPLPDELGVTLLGFSKVNSSLFVALSFIFNFIGIVLIGSVANILQTTYGFIPKI